MIYLYQTFLQYATRHQDFPNKLAGNAKAKAFEGYTLPANRTIQKYSVSVVPMYISRRFIKFGKMTDDSEANHHIFKILKRERTSSGL